MTGERRIIGAGNFRIYQSNYRSTTFVDKRHQGASQRSAQEISAIKSPISNNRLQLNSHLRNPSISAHDSLELCSSYISALFLASDVKIRGSILGDDNRLHFYLKWIVY